MRRPLHTLLALSALASAACAQEKVNPGAQALADFQKRAADYVKQHKRVQSEIHGLKPTNSPDAIEKHEHKLQHEMREARREAKQGDVFTPEATAEFRRLIGDTLKGPEAARIRESMRSAAPVALRELRVNGRYPPGLALQTTPPSLLKNLPELPPELDYRVVGHTLILRDVEANLIVDWIPDVIS
jgi:hypothetical protein